MKHIKTYTKLFESIKLKEIEKNLEDMLLDISDFDIPVEVITEERPLITHGGKKNYFEQLLITIGNDEHPKPVKIEKIIDILINANQYITDELFDLDAISIYIKSYPTASLDSFDDIKLFFSSEMGNRYVTGLEIKYNRGLRIHGPHYKGIII